jgi:hypothetical protein
MTNKPTGGPAYPHTGECDTFNGSTGMTLRDAIAIAAMQGMLAGDQPICKLSKPEIEISKAAYLFADAMLLEREK